MNIYWTMLVVYGLSMVISLWLYTVEAIYEGKLTLRQFTVDATLAFTPIINTIMTVIALYVVIIHVLERWERVTLWKRKG